MNKELAVKLPETRCPYCDSKLDAATPAMGHAPRGPKKDDLTVCISCASPLAFGEGLSVRKVTDEELESIRRRSPMTAAVLDAAIQGVKVIRRTH